MLIMTEKSSNCNDMRLAAEFTPSSLGPPLDVVVDAVLASGTSLPELDQVLLPLKGWVSATVDTTLHLLGYPIARDGVVLTIGAYSLLIADACSGLNSMVALSGIGLLYVYLAGHTSRAHNITLLLSILPIAFLANIIRVALLVLITYYRGESSGKAFHDHAGVLEVALAFGGLFAFDHLLMLLHRTIRAPRPLVPARHSP